MRTLLPLLFLFSFEAMAQLIIEDNVKFLALGDSYTIGESVMATERWPARILKEKAVVINAKQLP